MKRLSSVEYSKKTIISVHIQSTFSQCTVQDYFDLFIYMYFKARAVLLFAQIPRQVLLERRPTAVQTPRVSSGISRVRVDHPVSVQFTGICTNHRRCGTPSFSSVCGRRPLQDTAGTNPEPIFRSCSRPQKLILQQLRRQRCR